MVALVGPDVLVKVPVADNVPLTFWNRPVLRVVGPPFHKNPVPVFEPER